MTPSPRKVRASHLSVALFALVVVALLAGGYWYYRSETERIRQESYAEIAAIAELKAGEILRWRQERLGDAGLTAGDALFSRAVAEWLGDPEAQGPRNALLGRLKLERAAYQYADALLLDPQGEILLSASDEPDPTDPPTQWAVTTSFLNHEATLSDFFRDPHGTVRIDVVAPILDSEGQPLAVIALRSDADVYLFPLIQTWPSTSRSAETLLVSRVGDSVVYLNALRHQANTALSLTFPLTRTDIPAVQAALGVQGPFEGLDYRGVRVLADLRPLPGSPWFMVAKVDTGEILAEASYRGIVIALFVVLGSALVAAMAAYVSRQRRAHLYGALYRAEREQRQAQEAFRTTLYSIGDAVITTNNAGQVQHMNPVAESLTGWSEAEARGHMLDQVFRIVNEKSHALVENPVQRVLREGTVVGLADHTLLISKDRVERHIVDSGAPIRDESGDASGVVLVFRDQTGERAAQAAILASETRYRRLFEAAKDGILILDAKTGAVVDVNPFLIALLGLPREDLIGKKIWELGFLRDVTASQDSFRELQQLGYVRYDDLPLETADGRRINVEFVSNVYEVDHQRVIQCNIRDITDRKRAERALSASETRYRRLFEAAKDGILILDADTGVIVDVNPFLVERLGFSREEMVGKRVWELGFLKDVAASQDAFAELQQRGYVRYDDLPLETADGRRINVEFISNVYEVDHHRVIQCNIRDITERVLAKAKIAQTENRFRALIDNAPDGVVLLGLDGRYKYASPAALRVLGYNAEDIPNSDPNEQTHPDDLPMVLGVLQNLIANPTNVPTIQYRFQHQNGKWRWIESTFTNLLPEPGVEAIVINFRDITERKQAEVALALERSLLRTLIDNLPDAVYAKDSDARKVFANRLDVANIGANSEAEVLGKTDAELYPAEVATRSSIDDLAVLKGGAAVLDREELLVSKTGQQRWLLTSKVPLRDAEGAVIGLVGIGRDITERKQAEAEREKLQAQLIQAQKMEAVGRLAGGVAHDFNNMLTVILGNAQLAQSSVDPSSSGYADIQEIINAGERSADLTRQLLAFARKQTIAPQVVDLSEAVAGMLKMLRRLIGEDISLLFRPSASLWKVKMDPAQIDQLLANLATNARDAIAGVGKLTIEIDNAEIDEAYCRDHAGFVPGQYVMMSVSDDGSGMDQETQARLFEPFFTTKEVGKGTGLGLATVYGIVKQNKGMIYVYSELGQGTTFRIYLPRFQSAESVAEQATVSVKPPTGTETVLLVEDEPALLKLGQRQIEGLGYTVLAAAGPDEALRVAREHSGTIDLLVTDVIMPNMSGRELLQEIGILRPGLRCLFMSGYTAEVIAHQGVLDAGVQFMQKPFSREVLAQKLREALGSR